MKNSSMVCLFLTDSSQIHYSLNVIFIYLFSSLNITKLLLLVKISLPLRVLCTYGKKLGFKDYVSQK